MTRRPVFIFLLISVGNMHIDKIFFSSCKFFLLLDIDKTGFSINVVGQ